MEPIVTNTFALSADEPGRTQRAPVERPIVIAAVAGMVSALYGVFVDALVFRLVGGLLLGFVVISRLIARRQSSPARDAVHRQPRRYTITDDALLCETEDGTSSRTAWSSITEVNTRGEVYRLTVAGEPVLFIPLDAFASAADRKKFEVLLRDKGLLPG